jgi:hypothetical protein
LSNGKGVKGGYEIKVHFLDIFAVVAYFSDVLWKDGTLVASDSKQSLLENFVIFIPKGKACANVLMGITISANAVFALSFVNLNEMRPITQRKTLERA